MGFPLKRAAGDERFWRGWGEREGRRETFFRWEKGPFFPRCSLALLLLQRGQDAGQLVVHQGVETSAFALVTGDELGGGQDLLFLVGKTAQVEVGVIGQDVLYRVDGGAGHAVFLKGFAGVPPGRDGRKVLQAHGLGLGKGFVTFGQVNTVEPGLLGGAGLVEEQDIGGDAGVGRKNALGQADDGMQVVFRQQLVLKGQFGAVRAEQETVRQDDGGAALVFEAVHDERAMNRSAVSLLRNSRGKLALMLSSSLPP